MIPLAAFAAQKDLATVSGRVVDRSHSAIGCADVTLTARGGDGVLRATITQDGSFADGRYPLWITRTCCGFGQTHEEDVQ